MQRRKLLGLVATSTTIGLAGCLSGAEVSTTVTERGTHGFEAEEGNTIQVDVDLRQGRFALVSLEGPDGEILEEYEIETEEQFEYQVEQSGTHRVLTNTDGRVRLTVYVD